MTYHDHVVFTRQLNKQEKTYYDQTPTFVMFKSVTDKPWRSKIGKNQINGFILREWKYNTIQHYKKTDNKQKNYDMKTIII